MNNALLEVMTTKYVMADPQYVHGIRRLIDSNALHDEGKDKDKVLGFVLPTAQLAGTTIDAAIQRAVNAGAADFGRVAPHRAAASPAQPQMLTGGDADGNGRQLDEDEFVAIYRVCGPVTRGGDACSYGSIDHRNMMIRRANNGYCRGHVFYINTPGGSVAAISDYQQAIDYAHSKGQAVIAFIDGTCASLGFFLASLCDEVYYNHPLDLIGSIGVMAAFYTMANGDKDAEGMTYHEYYDPESYDKNRSHRDIADNDDPQRMIDELAAYGRMFRAVVKAAHPKATEAHIHGELFDARDLDGILVNGQASFTEAAQRAIDLYGKVSRSPNAASRAVLGNYKEAATDPANGGSCKPKGAASETGTHGATSPAATADTTANPNPSNPNTTMSKFPYLNAALGLNEGEMVLTDGSATLVEASLDAIEAHIKDLSDTKAALQQTIDKMKADAEKANTDAIQAALDKANTDHAAALQTLKDEHAKALNDAATAHAAALADKDKALTDANAALAKAKEDADAQAKALTDVQGQLSTVKQQLADKEAEVAALQNAPKDEHAGAPASNGASAGQTPLKTGYPTWDPSKTATENAKAIAEYKANAYKH